METASEQQSGISIPEFVITEAKEKCFEIDVRTLKEFERVKANIVDREVEDIKEHLEKELQDRE